MRKTWLLLGGMLLIGVAIATLLWAQAQPAPHQASTEDGACAVPLLAEQDQVEADTHQRLLNQLNSPKGLLLATPDPQALQPFTLTLPTPTQTGACAP